MQENMTKLNEFCKKNIQKVHKKRNATIQHQQLSKEVDRSQGAIKTSGRKLNFDNTRIHDQNEHDSSHLSTEFYEEYYKAIKTLKHDKINTNGGYSRQLIGHSPTSKSQMNPTT